MQHVAVRMSIYITDATPRASVVCIGRSDRTCTHVAVAGRFSGSTSAMPHLLCESECTAHDAVNAGLFVCGQYDRMY